MASTMATNSSSVLTTNGGMTQGRVADVGQLVEDAAGDVDGLSGGQSHALVTEAHLTVAFDDEVDFFLFLIVPGDLSSVGFERDIAGGKRGRLDRTGTAHEVLGPAPRGVDSARDLGEIGDDHEFPSYIGFLLKWQFRSAGRMLRDASIPAVWRRMPGRLNPGFRNGRGGEKDSFPVPRRSLYPARLLILYSGVTIGS